MQNLKYDYIIVGAGLFGAVFANECKKANKKCIVYEKRNHIAGNCYTEVKGNINIHKYGAHIFHTDKKEVWNYIRQFGEFDNYINQPVAVVGNETYNMPFNMNLFSKVYGVIRPDDIKKIIKNETLPYLDLEPTNLEEQAIKLVGPTIYNKFIKGYTEKQWGKPCTELPPEIIKRIPVRFIYDNNYFSDKFQGIPKKGYTEIIKNMLEDIQVEIGNEFRITPLAQKHLKDVKIIYTGMIDEFFDYKYGPLEYRSLQFVEIEKNTDNYQGCAVMNYPSLDVPYTRSIEHKHFQKDNISDKTIISYEFSLEYKHNQNMTPYYPIGNKENLERYEKYVKLSKKYPNIIFVGRLGEYKYYDMDDTIEKALELSKKLLFTENIQ